MGGGECRLSTPIPIPLMRAASRRVLSARESSAHNQSSLSARSPGAAHTDDAARLRCQWHPQAGSRAVESRRGVEPEPQWRGFDHPPQADCAPGGSVRFFLPCDRSPWHDDPHRSAVVARGLVTSVVGSPTKAGARCPPFRIPRVSVQKGLLFPCGRTGHLRPRTCGRHHCAASLAGGDQPRYIVTYSRIVRSALVRR